MQSYIFMLVCGWACRDTSRDVLNTSSKTNSTSPNNASTESEDHTEEGTCEQPTQESDPDLDPDVDPDVDQDGDGQSIEDGDCDDNNPEIYLGAEDVFYDGIDQNCDGVDDYDIDGDGIDGFDENGNVLDCDDQNPLLQTCCVLTECQHSILFEENSNGHLGTDFVYIFAGSFDMGSSEEEVGRQSDEDIHEILLEHDFLMMTSEISQGMFEFLMGYSSFDGQIQNYGVGASYPAYFVSWHMAADFANHLSNFARMNYNLDIEDCYQCQNSGQVSVQCSVDINPYECSGYRLPTEAEWEYAARSGSLDAVWSQNMPLGNPIDDPYNCSEDYVMNSSNEMLRDYAWYCGSNYDEYGSKEIATLLPNSWGLYDMHGNVWEWVQDDYGTYDQTENINPYQGFMSGFSVVRGGGWEDNPISLRAAEREPEPPMQRSSKIGFRLVRLIFDSE